MVMMSISGCGPWGRQACGRGMCLIEPNDTLESCWLRPVGLGLHKHTGDVSAGDMSLCRRRAEQAADGDVLSYHCPQYVQKYKRANRTKAVPGYIDSSPEAMSSLCLPRRKQCRTRRQAGVGPAKCALRSPWSM